MKTNTAVLSVSLLLLAVASPVLLAALIPKLLERKAWWTAKTKAELKDYFSVIISIAVVVPVVLLAFSCSITTFFPDRDWAYAMQYNTEWVVIDPKPHDCEFFKAPIGNKYCHFDRVVTTRKGDESLNHEVLVYVTWDKVSE